MLQNNDDPLHKIGLRKLDITQPLSPAMKVWGFQWKIKRHSPLINHSWIIESLQMSLLKCAEKIEVCVCVCVALSAAQWRVLLKEADIQTAEKLSSLFLCLTVPISPRTFQKNSVPTLWNNHSLNPARFIGPTPQITGDDCSHNRRFVGSCNSGEKVQISHWRTPTTYRCDLGLDALPEGPGVVLVLGGQCVPHPDHVVAHAQRQTPCAHRREGQGVDETTQGGQGPAAVQRGQVPAFNLEDKESTQGYF